MAFSFGSYSRRRRGFLFDNVARKFKLDDKEVATIDSGTGNVAVSGASVGGAFHSTSSAPSSPSNGDLWYDTDGDVIYAYVNDGTTNYWIDISGEGYYGTTGNTATYTGNVSGGNLSTGGIVSASGNVTGGNLTTAGAVTTATVTATGNISGGNISATGNVSGTLSTAAQPNVTSLGTLSSLGVTGNISGGNLAVGNSSPTHGFHVENTWKLHGSGVINVGRGDVYIEDNSSDNQDGTGITLRTSLNPGNGTYSSGTVGSMFAVRSSGQAARLWVGQTETSTGSNALTKASGSFKIKHPLESMKDTHYLVHSFVESPQCNNIYRGTVELVNGSATINLDTESNMSAGTFVALNRNVHCFTSNESDWDAVRGSVTGNTLTIECQNSSSTARVAWLVIGERQDQAIKDSVLTNAEGYLNVEVEKATSGLSDNLDDEE